MKPQFGKIIAEVRKRAGATPRDFNKKRDRVRMGFLRKMFDPKLAKQVRESKLLITKGTIFWGALVQANVNMFEPGTANYPGNMLYSTDRRMDDQPNILTECSTNLFSIKGESVAPELQVFANSLANEYGRDGSIPVPPSLTHGIPCKLADIEFERSHLHNSCITDRIMPILAHPSTDSIMVLPYWHWTWL